MLTERAGIIVSSTGRLAALRDIPGFPWPENLFDEFRAVFKFRPKLPLDEWAKANIVLSPEYSNSTVPLMLFKGTSRSAA